MTSLTPGHCGVHIPLVHNTNAVKRLLRQNAWMMKTPSKWDPLGPNQLRRRSLALLGIRVPIYLHEP